MSFTLEYIEYIEENKIYSFNSLRLYRSDLCHFDDFCRSRYPEFDITKLNELVLNSYKSKLLEEGRSNAAVNRKLTAIHGLWNWLRSRGLVSRDPFTQILRDSQYRNTKLESLTEDDVVILLDHLQHDLKTKIILELIYATGIRVCELVELTLADIDLDNQLITIPRSSRFKERLIPFNANLGALLADYIRSNELSKDSKLLLNKFGRRVSEREIFRCIQEAAKNSGLEKKVSASILRNSFIKHMKNNGAHQVLLRDLTGQKAIRV